MSLFHRHHWETIQRVSTAVWNGDHPEDKYPMYHKYITRQQCTKCGKEIVRMKKL